MRGISSRGEVTSLYTHLVPPVLLAFWNVLPPIVLGILAIIIIIFIIKSLIKFAIIVGAIALIVFVVWRVGWIG
jgi:hypothetical protein